MAIISNTGQHAYKSDLQGAFEALQEQRSDLLAMVRDMQLASRLLAVEEARRLRTDVDPDDPRVAMYTQANASILSRVDALEVEVQIANIRVPSVTKTETLVQGRVTDEAAKALAHVQVALVDEAGAPVAGLGPVETDDSGYYAFILQPAQVDALAHQHLLSLQVGNDSGKLVPAGIQPFSLTKGQVSVTELRLKAGELDTLKLRPSVMRDMTAMSAATSTGATPVKDAQAGVKTTRKTTPKG